MNKSKEENHLILFHKVREFKDDNIYFKRKDIHHKCQFNNFCSWTAIPLRHLQLRSM